MLLLLSLFGRVCRYHPYGIIFRMCCCCCCRCSVGCVTTTLMTSFSGSVAAAVVAIVRHGVSLPPLWHHFQDLLLLLLLSLFSRVCRYHPYGIIFRTCCCCCCCCCCCPVGCVAATLRASFLGCLTAAIIVGAWQGSVTVTPIYSLAGMLLPQPIT